MVDISYLRRVQGKKIPHEIEEAYLVEMRTAPDVRKWKIGDVSVTRILEMDTLVIPPEYMLKTTSAVVLEHDWLQLKYATPDGRLLIHIQAFIIEVRELRIMVDPCIGNHKPRQGPAYFNMLNTPFLSYLEEAGFPPDSIDMVLCTHLHLDHVGWNTRLQDGQWVPTFPNARYLFSRVEYDHTKTDTRLVGDETFSDSIQPILDAGLAELIEFDHHIADEIWLEPSPGHTPGHCSIRISSNGSDAVITGDLIHHAIQACEPDVCSTFCFDEDQARSTRRTFLERYSNSDILVLGTHFCDPTGIYVRPNGTSWKFEEAAETESFLPGKQLTSVMAEILRLERLRCDALLAGDISVLGELVRDDLVHIHTNGHKEDRRTYLEGVEKRLEFLQIERPTLDVRVYGLVAVMTGQLKQIVRVRETGQTVTVNALTTQVWIETTGTWKLASFHATRAREE